MGIQKLFTASDALPYYIISTFQLYVKVKDHAEISIRNIFQSIDTRDERLALQLFRLVFSETYIYKDFPQREDQDLQIFPTPVQIRLIEYLIKFECSASMNPYN